MLPNKPHLTHLFLYALALVAHSPTHVGKGGKNHVIRTQWFTPGLTVVPQLLVGRYTVNIQNNKGREAVRSRPPNATIRTICKYVNRFCAYASQSGIWVSPGFPLQERRCRNRSEMSDERNSFPRELVLIGKLLSLLKTPSRVLVLGTDRKCFVP